MMCCFFFYEEKLRKSEIRGGGVHRDMTVTLTVRVLLTPSEEVGSLSSSLLQTFAVLSTFPLMETVAYTKYHKEYNQPRRSTEGISNIYRYHTPYSKFSRLTWTSSGPISMQLNSKTFTSNTSPCIMEGGVSTTRKNGLKLSI